MCHPARDRAAGPRYSPGASIQKGGAVLTRVLVAYADEYRAYREVLASGISLLRPYTEVSTAAPADLEAKIALLDPRVVVCGVPGRADPGDRPAWVELPPEVGRPARIRVGARRREAAGLTLEGLLGVLDETEELVRAEAGRAADPGLPGSIHPTS